MRFACLLALISVFAVHGYSQSRSALPSDKVIITRKKIILTRSGKWFQERPERRIATIQYPHVSGLKNPLVLQKVRSLLSIKNIFDTSLQWYRETGWLDEFDYEVNYNANYILDITFTQSGMGAYPDTQSRTIPVDLKTGKILKARDLFVEDKFAELARMVDVKLQQEVAELIKAAREDKELNDAPSIIEALQDLKFEIKNLDDFSINDKGVTFLYDAGFPHVIQALQPNGRYLFSYSTLKPFIKSGSQLTYVIKGL